MKISAPLITALLLVSAVPAFAQDDASCKDNPMFTRMPNYVIASCEDQEFSTFEFQLSDTTKKVEGRYWSYNFEIKEGAKTAGPLQIGRNYWNPMAAKKGTRLVENLDSGGGQFVASMPGANGGGTVWVQVDVNNSGEMYMLHVVQETAMRQDVEMSANEMADALAKTGSVTLNNILFDTGKATLKAESETALKTVIELLKFDAALKLEVQGHTDNVGIPAANLKLSKDRADAVKAFLVKGGIVDARLTTAGFGDTKPVADNKTDEGKAQNRRVVLVKK
jgi:outer membrane protein OmpA-like peptidoglycan-associated protein